MYGPAWLRIGILALFGIASYLLPGSDGWPWGFDQWLWSGLRDVPPESVLYVPLVAAGATIIAECAGAFLPAWKVPVRRPAQWAFLLAVIAVGALWILRVHYWLGDLHGVDRDEAPWWTIEAAEPLGAYTFYHTYHGASALGIQPSTVFQIVSTLMGGSAVAALFLWARAVTPEWPLLLAMLLSSGFMVLFCGYPEKGTPKSLALVCWYIYFATRALQEKRAGPAAWSSLFLSLAILMHGSAACWLPAHAWFVWRRRPRPVVALGVALFLLPMLAVVIYVASGAIYAGGPWGNIAAPWQWIKRYCITNCGYDFFSLKHARDVVNCLLVLSPVAVLCAPEAAVRSRRGGDVVGWLLAGSAGFVFLSATWFPVFGYLSDWDIFATTPLVLSCLAAWVATTQLPAKRFRRLAAAWITCNLIHTASWWRYFQAPS